MSVIRDPPAPCHRRRSLTLVTNLALSAPGFSLAFADAGGVRAAAVLAAAPSPRHVQPAPQARAAVLLAVLARLPALAAQVALAADDAPELAAAAAAALAAAAGDSASGDADDAAALHDATSGALLAATYHRSLGGYVPGYARQRPALASLGRAVCIRDRVCLCVQV